MGTIAHHFARALCATACATALMSTTAYAVDVPSSAEIGRIKPEEKLTPVPNDAMGFIETPAEKDDGNAPEAAKSVVFQLKKVKVEGVTEFSEKELRKIYGAYIDKEISLDKAWIWAEEITQLYRRKGYFLTRAYVPAQSIEGGVLTINVVEGFISQIDIQGGKVTKNHVIRKLMKDLREQRPVKANDVENFLLKLNDVPGASYRAVLAPVELPNNEIPGAVKLVLVAQSKKGVGNVSFDNYGSRFLGPYEMNVNYATSFFQLQQTNFSLLSSLPADELKYFSLTHIASIMPNTRLKFSANHTKSAPGFTLEPFDIKGTSNFASLGVDYQFIRQRNENLAVEVSLDARNTQSDILGTPLSRDRIRAVRVGVNYDTVDNFNGYSLGKFIVTQGISGLGASDKGDLNLSRAEAIPSFTKAELLVSRLQSISSDFSLLSTVSGQISRGPLYSSEEFGYGGQFFGRAYDVSEITGDHGVAGALELRYSGWSELMPELGLTPYVFYDGGIVWNEDAAQAEQDSGTSTGLGVRFTTKYDISGNLGVAIPLTRQIETPASGASGDNYRILFQVNKAF